MLCDLNCGFLPLFSGEVLITLGVWGRAGSQASTPSHGDQREEAGDGDPAVPPALHTAPGFGAATATHLPKNTNPTPLRILMFTLAVLPLQLLLS